MRRSRSLLALAERDHGGAVAALLELAEADVGGVLHVAGAEAVSYVVPMTYRGAALAGAESALIGTAEHGVLGQRFLYDAPRDPVFIAQLVALFEGTVIAQHQNVSDTPDPTVAVTWDRSMPVSVDTTSVVETAAGTDIGISTDGSQSLTLHVVRRIDERATADLLAPVGRIAATWQLPDGSTSHGVVFAASAQTLR